MLVNNLLDLSTFSEVVKQGSLSSASKELGISTAVVSKRLRRLEEKLGTLLIARSTRTLRITEEGHNYFKHCQDILNAVEDAEDDVLYKNKKLRGKLKISAPSHFGQLHISGLITDFIKTHSEIALSINFSDQFVDLIQGSYDLAIRIGNLKDSNLVAKKIAVDKRIVVASPEYVDRYGKPNKPSELRNHNALIFSNPSPFNHWEFTDKNSLKHEVKVTGNFESNDCCALNQAVLSGLGIALRPLWDVQHLIESGELMPLLPDYVAPSFLIQAVYPSRHHLPYRVKLFIEVLENHFKKQQTWNV